jgi:hypothetical protein
VRKSAVDNIRDRYEDEAMSWREWVVFTVVTLGAAAAGPLADNTSVQCGIRYTNMDFFIIDHRSVQFSETSY